MNNGTCFVCEGDKRLRNPEHRDPIEGWKMADTHPCDFCGGAGHISPDSVRYNAVHAYNAVLLNDRRDREEKLAREDARIEKIKQRALKKLTDEEREALDV